MSEKKQALQVAALKNGTVIDHIPSEKLFTVVQLLGVEQMKAISRSDTTSTARSWVKKESSKLQINSFVTKRSTVFR